VISDIFGSRKPLIGMVHLPASPGQPQARHAAPLEDQIAAVRADVLALQDGGMDGLLFCNESDLPYTTALGQEVGAYAAFMIGAVRDSITVPYGVNLLWDPIASICAAAACGASFVREVMCGSYATEMGILAPDPALVAQTRTRLRADHIALFANVVPEFATALGDRTVTQRAKAAEYFGFDALLVSGPVAGVPLDETDLINAKEAVGIPVFANTGVREANVDTMLSHGDGAIVGSSLKVDGKTFNPVDPARVKSFVDAANKVR
jgi:membrane complex biogenesis BtpA family protein